jgi:hypothetical protein
LAASEASAISGVSNELLGFSMERLEHWLYPWAKQYAPVSLNSQQELTAGARFGAARLQCIPLHRIYQQHFTAPSGHSVGTNYEI